MWSLNSEWNLREIGSLGYLFWGEVCEYILSIEENWSKWSIAIADCSGGNVVHSVSHLNFPHWQKHIFPIPLDLMLDSEPIYNQNKLEKVKFLLSSLNSKISWKIFSFHYLKYEWMAQEEIILHSQTCQPHTTCRWLLINWNVASALEEFGF